MTLPRTAAQVLSGHVALEVRCIDRMLLTFRQPRLQYGQGIHGFFCHHRVTRQASLALLRHLQPSPAVITSQHTPVISRHTPNLTRNQKSLRGKITYSKE